MKQGLTVMITDHFDFVSKDGSKVYGSSCTVTNGTSKVKVFTKNPDFMKLELGSYKCDLVINDELKLDIANVRK